MNNKATVTTSGGIGVLGILQIIFVVLKVFSIGEVATWSWWVVLIPLWIYLGIAVIAFLLVGIIAVIAKLID